MIITKYYTLEQQEIDTIKAIIKQNKLNQEDIAKEMNVSLPYLNHWLTSRKRLNQKQLEQLQNILKIKF